ncbi:MAG: hypothetical protein HYR63_01760 [Proteobacteria bacterium]|nr:hypothetical protein [Pseudomonadota bacterium]
MTSDSPKKSRSQKAAAAESKDAVDHAASQTSGATPVVADAGLAQLRLAAGVALGLSILAVVLALTVPVWSPQLYGNAASARFLALGVAQLRPVLESDGPFSVELATLRKIASGDAEVTKALETIASDSDVGVPTLVQLHARFSRTAAEIAFSDIVDSHRSWFDRAMLSVASALDLHVWLKKMKEKHLPSDETVMEAQIALAAGDLAGAVDQMSKLSGRSAEIAEPWIRAARARIAATQVLKYLDRVAAMRLSGGSVRVAFTY